MSGKRQLVLLGLAVIGAWVVVLPAMSATPTPRDRVQVGRPGQNATAGFPLGLFTGVALLPGYRTVGLFDGESRNWEGPEYRAATLGGTSTLDWQVTFDRPGSATAMATKTLGGLSWPVAEQPTVRIQHLVGTRNVGSIPALALLTKAPGDNNAQYVSVVAFPLCRGLFVAAAFSLLVPAPSTRPRPRIAFSSRARRRSSGTTIAQSRRSRRSPSRVTSHLAASRPARPGDR